MVGWETLQKVYKQYINNEPSTMNKEWEELLKATKFPFSHPTSTNSPSEKKTKPTSTKHATKTTKKLTSWKETTAASRTTEIGTQNDVETTPIGMQKNNTSSTKKITMKTVKEKEVGNNPNPTTPSTRSSTRKKDTTTTKTTELKTIVPRKQVRKRSSTPPTKLPSSIANDKKAVGKKSSPTPTNLPTCIAKDKKLDRKKDFFFIHFFQSSTVIIFWYSGRRVSRGKV